MKFSKHKMHFAVVAVVFLAVAVFGQDNAPTPTAQKQNTAGQQPVGGLQQNIARQQQSVEEAEGSHENERRVS